MPNVKDCPGFETFGADVQQAREAVKMSRRELAEKVGIDPRYHIDNGAPPHLS